MTQELVRVDTTVDGYEIYTYQCTNEAGEQWFEAGEQWFERDTNPRKCIQCRELKESDYKVIK